MKMLYVTPKIAAVEFSNAELAVVRNALRDYAANHSYGAVMMDGMRMLFELDKPIVVEIDKGRRQ